MDALKVFAIALATALATGLGVIPVAHVRFDARRTMALATSVAAGFMLGASLALFYEGLRRNALGTALGTIAGVAFIFLSRRMLAGHNELHIGKLRGARGLTAVMVVGVMTLHSITEGVAVGVALASEASLGFLISIAIAIHNIPEGVAISLSMVPYGEKPLRAAGWSIFSSLPQPLMALPAFLAVRTFEPLLPAGLGFAGGAMVWMVVTQLIPEMRSEGRLPYVALTASAAAMVAIELSLSLF